MRPQHWWPAVHSSCSQQLFTAWLCSLRAASSLIAEHAPGSACLQGQQQQGHAVLASTAGQTEAPLIYRLPAYTLPPCDSMRAHQPTRCRPVTACGPVSGTRAVHHPGAAVSARSSPARGPACGTAACKWLRGPRGPSQPPEGRIARKFATLNCARGRRARCQACCHNAHQHLPVPRRHSLKLKRLPQREEFRAAHHSITCISLSAAVSTAVPCQLATHARWGPS